MNQISDRIMALQPSATLAMSQKSSQLKAQGIDVINLSVGEPDFPTPKHIKEAAKSAIDNNFSFYTPVGGYLSLRQAISDKLQHENGVHYAPEQIVVGNGAKHELCNVVMSMINPGDEVVIPTPAWVSYMQMVILAGGTCVEVPCSMEQGFKMTPQQLEAAITPKTKLLILCSPSNPTGAVYSKGELQALAQVLGAHPQVLVLADEIYEHINYVGGHESIAQFSQVAGRVAIVNGVSKAYAMTGWRIGYVAAPLWLAKAVTKLQGQYTSGASSIAQKAAEAAYRGSQECVEAMRSAFERRRNLIVSLLRGIPGIEVNVPDGAFYVFPSVKAFLGKKCGDTVINDATDLALYLLNEAHVATVSGDAFACPGHLRLSYATDDKDIVGAVSRIATALSRLQ
ncbi:MAG: pyridoxal phosphate-dependent aminotransferase [Muribaculaceae bacterium]|nr:pyridoxal phosphate-dependent aminotransferase [Muribaculaceae bacterium]